MLDSSVVDDLTPWLIFFAAAAAIVAGGTQLAREGDRIAEQTGIGGLWIGAILLASATSLPEVVTDVSAAIIEEPDLAVGDLMGSSMANMMVLAVVDLIHRRHRVLQRVSQGHTLVASLAIALTALAASFVLADLGWSVARVGVDTIIIAVLYLMGTRVVFRQEYLQALARIAERTIGRQDADQDAQAQEQARPRMPQPGSLAKFAAGAAVILVAAPFLASSGSDISDRAGLDASFVGVALLAVTTSLPELVTSIWSVRHGAYDLAVGNLFGSNAFNIFALVFVDIAYRQGPVLSDVSQAQAIAALFAVLLMATAMMGIIYHAERRFWLLEPDAGAIMIAYLAGLLLVYEAGR